jgi:hypothetical protein
LADTFSASISKSEEDLKDILSLVFSLYMTSAIERDLVRKR